MYRKDQKKGIVAIVLFGSIGVSYFLFGEEVAKIVAIVTFAIWLASLYFLNRGA